MAKRRCIGVDVFESEVFLRLSDKAKVLYVYYILRSDDEGVVINPKLAQWIAKAGEQEIAELTDTGLVLWVDGVYVIRHWNVHNRIQPSRRTDSLYQSKLSKLFVNQLKEYEFVDEMSTNC